MNRTLSPVTAFAALVLMVSALPSAAQAPSPAEEKLRDALKGVTLQLRTAESEKAVAAAEKAAADQKNAELTAQIEKLSKQLTLVSRERAEEQEKATAIQNNLEGVLAKKQEELTAYQKSLDKWKAAHSEISDIAKKKEAARAALERKSAALERNVTDLRSRNLALFATANEILDRYRKFGLGQAISAREPFTGLTRVKLQNQVQEYNTKLLDQTAPASTPAPQKP
ncbi:MAG: phage major capsid protein [Verrucomicrobiaceae bacterium]|nr:MAG: phage major capsid protein [Verrucomicrobiaceae bacterium]